jgi:uncharacterized protein YpmB
MKIKHKIVWGLAVVFVIALIFGFRFIVSVQEGEWAIQRQAIQTAYEKTNLAKPNKVERFIGDKQYTVIQGEDQIGQPVIVWVGEDEEVITVKASDGITKEKVQEMVLSKDPDSVLLRITPGKLDDQLVWEAFYKKETDQGERYFYDYYTFKDGALIDTYKLNIWHHS